VSATLEAPSEQVTELAHEHPCPGCGALSSCFTMVCRERRAAADLQDIIAAHDYALVLFQNDHRPTRDDVRDDYFAASFPGYAPIRLTPNDWVVLPRETASATVPWREWVQTANAEEERIYGYLIVRADTGELRRVERFPDGPYSMMVAGDTVGVTATLSLVGGGP
jgi:hypothetical protein